jgi:hypothetical protein
MSQKIPLSTKLGCCGMVILLLVVDAVVGIGIYFLFWR